MSKPQVLVLGYCIGCVIGFNVTDAAVLAVTAAIIVLFVGIR